MPKTALEMMDAQAWFDFLQENELTIENVTKIRDDTIAEFGAEGFALMHGTEVIRDYTDKIAAREKILQDSLPILSAWESSPDISEEARVQVAAIKAQIEALGIVPAPQ